MRNLILGILLFLTNLSYSNIAEPPESTGSINGTIIDKQLQEPLPFVTITILDANGGIITGGISDDNGNFLVDKIPEGKHSVAIQFIGYKTYSQKIDVTKKNKKIDLGVIALEEEAATLNEVTVVAEVTTIKQKVDRKVITIGKDLSTTGPTAGDIMNNLPSVSVDQQTGSLSLRGNQNVQVMVDGKLSNVPVDQLLKQIPSTSIKQIELITNPSAKYNPEGMSGLINIILHKNSNLGYNATLNTGFTYQDNPKWNAGVDLNYRNGKVNLYSSWGGNYNKERNYGFVDRPNESIYQDFGFFNDNNSNLFKVGVDYYINDKNTLSIFTNQNLFNGYVDGTADVDFNVDENDVFQTFHNGNKNTSEQYNVDYKVDLAKEGSYVELEIDHNIFDGNESGDFRFLGVNTAQDYNDLIDTERNRTTINLDYEHPISESLKVEAGAQARIFDSKINRSSNQLVINPFNLNSDPETFIPSPSTNFDYSRDIYSLYGSLNKKWDKWSAQFGLRVESVSVNARTNETFEEGIVTDDLSSFETDPSVKVTRAGNSVIRIFGNDYQQLYPSLFLTYSASEKNQYQFSYSRRVDRPGIGQVNPIREFSTPLLSGFGNPSLVPQFTNSVEVNYTRTLKKGSITAGLFYRKVSDMINQALLYNRTDPNLNSLVFTNDNFDDTASYGVEVSSNYKPTKWWSINASFDLFAQKQTSFTETIDPSITDPTVNDIEDANFEIDNVVYNFRVFNNFKATKKLSFSAFLLYRGPNQNVQFDIDPMFMTNVGARYTFWKDKATFSLNYNDVFNTMKFQGTGTRPFNQNIQFNWESNTINAALSVRLGSNKYRAKSRKRRNKDEKEGGGIF
ncbi:outer membrane beta-barrel family protein [Dokdonia sp. Hel_I_53]|uniref:outer membrane beta-barrel family protein n=1 Tax=Dokdonia sp. Hel_I_53 TaxID=1566287 RepID=UPI00119AB7EA|nr:outer membrane beta-barrel family protein [Dokdonia sp. Hel_I_53]TVZ52994.1 outer membrane receptor protein involved in Fe transport [Dokdonia sp. Hel_I_53]